VILRKFWRSVRRERRRARLARYLSRARDADSGVTCELIMESAKKSGLAEIYTASGPNKLPKLLAAMLREGDVVLTIGAGTITEAAPSILRDLAELQTLELSPEQEH